MTKSSCRTAELEAYQLDRDRTLPNEMLKSLTEATYLFDCQAWIALRAIKAWDLIFTLPQRKAHVSTRSGHNRYMQATYSHSSGFLRHAL